MLKEFFESLTSHAAKANTVKSQTVERKIYVSRPDGTVDVLDAELPARAGTVLKIEDFATVLDEFAVDDDSPVLLTSYDGAVLVVDMQDKQRDTWRFDVSMTERFKELCEPHTFDQKELIKFLRQNEIPSQVIANFRKLDFRRKSDGTRTKDHGRESLGRSIEAEVSGEGDLPDELNIDVQPVEQLGLTCKLRIGVEIDAETERFELFPIRSSVEEVHEKLLDRIYYECTGTVGEKATVIRGTRTH